MLRLISLFLLTFSNAFTDDFSFDEFDFLTPFEGNKYAEPRIVKLEDGVVSGEKYWDGDFYEFYGIPYATVPKGQDRFKAPLPAEKWDGILTANNNRNLCPQTFYTGENPEEIFIAGEEDCLTMNLLVPEIATEKNLVPVIIYIHSGAFAVGNANMANYRYLARHDVIVGSFNFRLGAVGFNCLGTEDIPGNAGMKDAVAALRWINRNIKKFGGDPKRVTLAGFSVGATMAELLALSKATDGLIDKLILESGSALSTYAINRDPIATAYNIAKSLQYNGTSDLKSLTEFYLNATTDMLAVKSLNFFLKNSTFGFAPCIENKIDSVEPFLTESPLEIFKRGDYKKIPVLTGFANMEGISRALKFDEWSEEMNRDFSEFLPADLQFDSKEAMENTIDEIRVKYFNNEEVTYDNLQGYIDYFSDSMFKYPIIKSAKYHAANSKIPVFVYEFAYVGTLNMRHNYMDRIKGASHRDQSSYVLDFFSFTSDEEDLNVRDLMTSLWTDFVKYKDPTRYESPVIDFKWPPYTEKERNYLLINVKTEPKKDLSLEGYTFWNNIFEKYYWTPTAPVPPPDEPQSKPTDEQKSENSQDKKERDQKTESNDEGKKNVKGEEEIKNKQKKSNNQQ